MFAQAGGPLSFYASSRVLLPLTDTPSPGAEIPSLAIGNFCLLGTAPRPPGSFTEQDHAVLRNLAKRVSRELQLGYQERRRVRAQAQADFVSTLLQESQISRPDLKRRESPGMHAVKRDQLSHGMSLLSTSTSDSLATAIKGMCSLSSATSATVLDMRAFVKSSMETSAAVDPRRPALRRTQSSLAAAQKSLGGMEGAGLASRLSNISLLSSSVPETNLEGRLNEKESLLGIERALQQWRSVSLHPPRAQSEADLSLRSRIMLVITFSATPWLSLLARPPLLAWLCRSVTTRRTSLSSSSCRRMTEQCWKPRTRCS